MQTYEIPRDYKGESRILYIFSIKGLAYTGIGAAIGGIFYLIFKVLGMQMIGIGFVIFLGLIGFCIGTFKIPDSKRFKLTEKTGGEGIDDVIKRWIKFKRGKNKIYVYLKEETKDE
ncbi:MAG: PrgI family protein [Clostridia bacterium]|nr:PrgI family protein [Clostridia bacterium]